MYSRHNKVKSVIVEKCVGTISTKSTRNKVYRNMTAVSKIQKCVY